MAFLMGTGAGAPAADKSKPVHLEVVELSARRQDGLILLDARVKNVGERPINGLMLVFRFEADANTVVTTQRQKADEPSLAPGEESELTAQMRDTPRAVQLEVGAFSKGAEMRVGNSGPFPIE